MKALLEKMFPLERMISLANRIGLLAGPMSALADLWLKAQGVRTQACLAGALVLAALAFFGYVPWETVDPVIQTLIGLAGAALADKINRVLPSVKTVSKKAADEAKKKKSA